VSAPDKICVVDDDEAVRESLDALLAASGFETESFASGAEFLARFDPAGVACILLDVRMPRMDGVTLLRTLPEALHHVPVIMMTAHGDVPTAVRAMQAGAADFVEKPFSSARLIDSIRQAIARSAPAPTAAADPDAGARFATLTPRETEVMRQMVMGLPNKIIAFNLGMSPRTVEVHRGRVMRKTGAASLSHLVRMAIRAGIDPDPA
jgi:two-component system response regulator FixJ